MSEPEGSRFSIPFSKSTLLAALFLFFTVFTYALPGDGGGGKKDEGEKVSKTGVYEGYTEAQYKGFSFQSYYVTMDDSTNLAVDVYLPKRLEDDKQVPTIIYLTRYVRSMKAKFPFNLFKHPIVAVTPEEEIKFLASHGYAVVIVDVRGTGASEGTRSMEFTPREVKDGAQVVDWIIEQDWSNGKVASSGISYLGTTAELLLVNQHPAVKACIPRSAIFDLYNHIMYPGGVRHGPFIKVWAKTINHLDNNDFSIFGKKAKRLLRGTNPVDSDKKKKIYDKAIAQHKNNFDVYEGLDGVVYRDDKHPDLQASANKYSVHNNIDKISNSGTAIYRIGGWYDGALPCSVIEGFLNTPNTQKVLIGPWDHGPHDMASPHSPTKELSLDVNIELLRYFDYHLKGIDNGILEEEPFRYYTVGEEQWKTTDTWPLPHQQMTTWHFSQNNTLVADDSERKEGNITYTIDTTATTGPSSRWNSVTGLYKNGPTDYPDRREESAKLLNFETEPFNEDTEVTGHAEVEVFLAADATDANVFCYIEDVAPDGTVYYVTEGMLNAKHRKVTQPDDGYVYPGPFHSYKEEDALPLKAGEVAKYEFALMPISYQIKKGHRLRVSIAGVDKGHFDRLDNNRPTEFKVHFSKAYPSKIELPIIPANSATGSR